MFSLWKFQVSISCESWDIETWDILQTSMWNIDWTAMNLEILQIFFHQDVPLVKIPSVYYTPAKLKILSRLIQFEVWIFIPKKKKKITS